MPRKAKTEAKETKSKSTVQASINEKIRYLIRLSKEQGYLTFGDINDALPESVDSPEDIENVISILQNLEIDILDPGDVESYKQRQEEAEEEQTKTSQHDILDDPVRMYLKQMGQVPLLTREQEVEISKRIENSELKAQKALFSIGITASFQIALAQKLLNREERFDRIVIDKKLKIAKCILMRCLSYWIPVFVRRRTQTKPGTKCRAAKMKPLRSEPKPGSNGMRRHFVPIFRNFSSS